MTIETREEVLERILTQEKPLCPHCGKEMSIWEVPLMTFSDGLGWDSPYMFICFNDECPMYVSGWDNLMENYAQRASYRCIKSPNNENYEAMPVFSPVGAQGQIIDSQIMAEREAMKEAIKKGFSILADCYVARDEITLVQLMMDPSQPSRVRLKAAEMTGDVAGIDAIDLISSHRFGNELLQKAAEDAIAKIHERHFTRECPFCAEIIKKRAKICKHCGKEVAGE
jgi:predicted RNA-binding Zn-ribbon protein involved in translation (DUF1610 family)